MLADSRHAGPAEPAADQLAARTRQRLDRLERGGLFRSLQAPSGIDLSSNDYLNLSRHPLIVRRLAAAVSREGAGSTGSRLLRGERDAFSDVERCFAEFKRVDRALYFSSGYLANLAVLGTLPEAGDTIFSDARNHASLIDAARLSRARRVVFPHSDVEALARLLEADRRSGATGVRFIVTESLFSMDGDVAPLQAYAALAREAGAVLVVDEAHAVGVYGERGTGLIEAAGPEVAAATCVSINPAGKALGVAGAFVAGCEWAVEYLLQRARSFVFSTAPPPALADALAASLEVVRDEPDRRARVLARAAYLRRRLAARGIEVWPGASQIVPIVVGGNERAVQVAAALQREGFDVRAIRPPTVPDGTARLRVSVQAALDEPTLDRFVAVLAGALEEAGLCPAVYS